MRLFKQKTDADKPYRLRVLMRSGNSFVIDGVTDYAFEKENNTQKITSINLTQLSDSAYTRILLGTLDLTQIEAVIVLPR